jgi:hypothetical protein
MRKCLITVLALSAALVAVETAWADHTPYCPPGSRHPGGKWDRAHGGKLSHAVPAHHKRASEAADLRELRAKAIKAEDKRSKKEFLEQWRKELKVSTTPSPPRRSETPGGTAPSLPNPATTMGGPPPSPPGNR